MALTIEELNIQIEAESTTATTAIDTLIGRLETLQSKLNGLGSSGKTAGKGLQETAKGATKADTATSKYSNTTNKATQSSRKFTDALAQKISKFHTLYGAFKSVANTMASWFNESNEYIETLNLFRVTMGDGADAAYEYAESVQKLIGIDIKDWMQYQGVFKNLTAGFGVSSDAANTMSKNLTQLSYDMASFFNTDVETAFDKLSSAMSGQVKGLREFGIDTTVASLQEYALSKGIETSVRSMTQAEKSLLRYNYIMEKSIIMQGDMARTLITPANSLRILNAQLTQLKRALGNIISVVAVKFIPYVQAFVEILTEAANALANLFGFELPEIDYSGLGGNMTSEFEDSEDSLDGVSGKVKDIKKQLMGFDELNIISNPDSDSDSGSGGGGGGGGLGGMEPLEYDFLKGLDTSKLDTVKQTMKKILEYVGLIGTGIFGWKLGSFLSNLLTANIRTSTLKESLALLGKKLTLTAGITLAVTGIVLETKGIISAFKEGLNKVNFAEILGGGGLIVAGGALIGKFFGSALLGSGIGAIVAGIPMFVTGLYDAIVNGLNWLNSLLIPAGATLTGAGIGAIIGMLGGPIGAGIGALIGLAVGLVTDLVILIVQNWESITAWCSQACKDIGQFFVDLWGGIVSIWNTVAEWFNTNVITPVVNFFVGLWEDIVSLAQTCWDGIVNIWTVVSEWFNTNIIQPVVGFFVGLWNGLVSAASACWEGIKTAWSAVTTWFDTYIIQPIVNLFVGMWNGIVAIFTPIIEWFAQLFGSIWQTIKDVFYNIGVIVSGCWEIIKVVWGIASEWFNVNVIQPVAQFFTDLWNGIVSVAQTCWEGIVTAWTVASTWFNTNVITPVTTFFTNLWNGIKNAAVTAWNGIVNAWTVATTWFSTNVITPVTTFFTNLWSGIKNAAVTAWNGIKTIYSTISNYINTNIIIPVSKFFTGLWDGFKEGARKAWEGVKSVFSTVGTFFKTTFTNAWNGIVKVFSVAGEIFVSIKDGIVSAFKFVVNGIIKGINSVVSIPFGAINDALTFLKNLEIVGIQPFKNIRSINVPQIPLLAQGGIVDAGQMFIAREAGPELVGSIGRKTAVANNDQIVSGIESGVYRAVMAANSTNKGGTQTIRIINEIDGDVVGEKVIQYHNGKVMQTGASPLLV